MSEYWMGMWCPYDIKEIYFKANSKEEAEEMYKRFIMLYKDLLDYPNKPFMIEADSSAVRDVSKGRKLDARLGFSVGLGFDNIPVYDEKDLYGGISFDHVLQARSKKRPDLFFKPVHSQAVPIYKGRIYGKIDIDYSKNKEWHINKIIEIIDTNLKEVVPDWVWNSKNGQDENHFIPFDAKYMDWVFDKHSEGDD